jgi:hypothetical protein
MPLDNANNYLEMIQAHGFQAPKKDLGLATSKTVFPIAEMALGAHAASDNPELPHAADACATSETHKAIVRTDTNEFVGVVSSKYRPLRNEDLFGTIEAALNEAIPEEMFRDVQVRDRVSGGGSWSQREYVLPAYAEELKNSQFETRVGLRIIAWNSYDGSASAGLMTGLIDFYCTNGMIVGNQITRELKRHSTRLTPEDFLPRLTKNLSTIHEEIDGIRGMMHTPLNSDAALEFLEKNLSAKRAAEMFTRMQQEVEVRGSNVFALHSALTYYASHDSESFATRAPLHSSRTARMLRGREDEVLRLVRTPEFQGMLVAA